MKTCIRNTCVVPGTHEQAMSLLNLPSASTVLDLGCYEGAFSTDLIEQGHIVMSCDVVARKGVETLPNFQVVDANGPLPYPDSTFDAIVCTDVIEHLENPSNLMRECARTLKLHGILLLSTPNTSNLLSRVLYLIKGEFPLFRRHHFDEWSHISPISMAWIEFTAHKYGFRVDAVASEKTNASWRRKLFHACASPFLYWFLRRQPGAMSVGETLIVRLRKVP